MMVFKRMLKNIPFSVGLLLIATSSAAIDDVRLEMVNHKSLKEFTFIDDRNESDENIDLLDKSLVKSREFSIEGNKYIRYQQYYKGIQVLGRDVVAHFSDDEQMDLTKAEFSGKLAKEINLPIDSVMLTNEYRMEIEQFARNNFLEKVGTKNDIKDPDNQPIIWIDSDQTPHLSYQVSFRVGAPDGSEMWPHYLIDAADSSIYHYWDNVKTSHKDKGPGGNRKTGRYVYGEDGLPFLQVERNQNVCQLFNINLIVVSMNNQAPQVNLKKVTPVYYECNNNLGSDAINGAYSPSNDAYMFGDMVVSMYKRWYGLTLFGAHQPILLLTHVGVNYQNASWNGQFVSLGDGGRRFYPFTSLALLAHEMTHAFTQYHAGLFGFGQSGSLNESFSDMAAMTAKYFLLKNNPEAYKSIYGQSHLTWLFGEQISKMRYPLRSINQPSKYGSAECYRRVSGCSISFKDISENNVHAGSGVFNKAFYELAMVLNGDVKRAFELMLKAHILHWTANSTFSGAACGVKLVAIRDGISESKINSIFKSVGVTPGC
ncbi:MAG: M4 family metallopeptidase [Endozoicomonadaceae bacterium]|nr:M4 family metallopeptidase [Endozoicomonadaceae bacterium]